MNSESERGENVLVVRGRTLDVREGMEYGLRSKSNGIGIDLVQTRVNRNSQKDRRGWKESKARRERLLESDKGIASLDF